MVRTLLDDHQPFSERETVQLLGLFTRDDADLPRLVACGPPGPSRGPLSINLVEERLPGRTLHLTRTSVFVLSEERLRLLRSDGALVDGPGGQICLQLLVEGGDHRDSRNHSFIFRVGGGGSCTCGAEFRGQNPDEEFLVHAADAREREDR